MEHRTSRCGPRENNGECGLMLCAHRVFACFGQVVWRGVWSWMKGVRPFEDTTETAAKAGRLEDTETEALLAQLQNATMDAERMRVGAAYALGRKAADGKRLHQVASSIRNEPLWLGSPNRLTVRRLDCGGLTTISGDRAALKGLLREVAGPTESTRRAAVRGCESLGGPATDCHSQQFHALSDDATRAPQYDDWSITQCARRCTVLVRPVMLQSLVLWKSFALPPQPKAQRRQGHWCRQWHTRLGKRHAQPAAARRQRKHSFRRWRIWSRG